MQRHLPSLILLSLIGLIAYGYGMGKRDLWAPDEPRFGLAAREMLQRLRSPDPEVRRSAPFVLHVNNIPYSDKPPLYIWLAAALDGGDGSTISSRAVRIPSVGAGIAGLWIIYALGMALFQRRRAALLSALVLATMLMYAWQAGRAQLDMLMSMWAYLAMLAFWMGHNSKPGGRRLGWFALFWAAGALGTLSKGPPAILIPLGTAAFFHAWNLNARKARQTAIIWGVTIFAVTILARFEALAGKPLLGIVFVAFHGLMLYTIGAWGRIIGPTMGRRFFVRAGAFLLGAVLWAAIVGIWFIPYKMYGPQAAVADTLISQNLTRYFAAENHEGSLFYYLINLPHNLLPWSLFVFAAIYCAWKGPWAGADAMPREPRRLLLAWMLFAVVFFSLSPGKRDQYLLPALPAFALLCGWFLDAALACSPGRRMYRWISAGGYLNAAIALLGAAGLFFAAFLFIAPGPQLSGWRLDLVERYQIAMVDLSQAGFLWAGLLVAALGIALLVLTMKRHLWGIVVASALLMTTITVYMNGWVYPPINPRKSGRIVSEKIMELREAKTTPVASFGIFKEDYILYGDFFFTEIKDNDAGEPQLGRFLEQPGQALVMMRSSSLKKIRKNHPDWPVRVLFQQPLGRRTVVIIDNQPVGDEMPEK